MNLKKFLLNITKVGGFAVVAPLAVPFTVFGAYEDKHDFVILDTESYPVWEDLLNGNWPSYCAGPVILQLELRPHHFNGTFVASELLNPESDSSDAATFDLRVTAPKLLEFFAKKGLLVVPSIFGTGSCVKKVKHVNYEVDMSLLRKPLQLPTATMKRAEEEGFLENPQNWRFANNIYFGARYFVGGKPIRRVCGEIDPGSG